MLWKCRLVGTSVRHKTRQVSSNTWPLSSSLTKGGEFPRGTGSPVGKTYITPFFYLPSGMMTWQGRHCISLNVIFLFTFAFYFSNSKPKRNTSKVPFVRLMEFSLFMYSAKFVNFIGLKD